MRFQWGILKNLRLNLPFELENCYFRQIFIFLLLPSNPLNSLSQNHRIANKYSSPWIPLGKLGKDNPLHSQPAWTAVRFIKQKSRNIRLPQQRQQIWGKLALLDRLNYLIPHIFINKLLHLQSYVLGKTCSTFYLGERWSANFRY